MSTPLREELLKNRKSIITEQLSMSVGELINLYEDEEINLEPTFQRLFRWDDKQKSDFIESILLGYPIPAIFVLQSADGVWDVIDGVQRLSTIYHFSGCLKDSNNKKVKPLCLKRPRTLSSLENHYYSQEFCSLPTEQALDKATRIDFKRASIPVLILKQASNPSAKYELFRRLNTGGSHLSHQEIRNALMLMSNEGVYNTLAEYSCTPLFVDLINIPDSKADIRMDMEVLVKYLVLRNYPNLDTVSSSIDINEFLDDAIKLIIENSNFNLSNELSILNKLFDFLATHISDDYGFRIYNTQANKFKGSFNWFAFETIIFGCTILNDISILDQKPKDVLNAIKSIQSVGDYTKKYCTKSTLRVIERLKESKKYAKQLFDFS